MSKNKLQPSRELLEKVMVVADVKAQLPLEERAYLNDWGVYCRVSHLPGGALFYQAGGKLIARLRFTVERDGSIIIQKYQPGDWELALEPTCSHAKFRGESGKAKAELYEFLADAQSIEERILRLEKRVSERSDGIWEQALGDLYSSEGRFKDAERAYIKRVEIWSNEWFPHYFLGLFYLHAVSNAKLLHLPPSLFDGMWGHLTLQALGYNYEQAQRLIEEHIGEALKLAPPKNSLVKNSLEEILSELKRVDKAPFPQKELLELGEALVMLEKHPEEATKNLEQIVDRNLNFALGWSYLSMAYRRIGRLKDAERVAITAVKLAPDNAICHFSLSSVYYVALCNSKGHTRDSIERFKRLFGPERVQQLRSVYPSISIFLEDEPPEWMEEVTLEALGCGYDHARQMVENHASETIRLSEDKNFTEEAESQLATLRMMDKITHNTVVTAESIPAPEVSKAEILEEICQLKGMLGISIRGASHLTYAESNIIVRKVNPLFRGLSWSKAFPVMEEANEKEINEWLNHPLVNSPLPPEYIMDIAARTPIPVATMERILRKMLQEDYDMYWRMAEAQVKSKK